MSLQLELRKQACQWIDLYSRYIIHTSNKLGKWIFTDSKLVRAYVISLSNLFTRCHANTNTNENWWETIHCILWSLASSSFEQLSSCLPFWSSEELFGSMVGPEEQPENDEILLQTLSDSLSINLIKFRNSNSSTKSECYYPERNAPKLWEEEGSQGCWR